LYVFTHVEWMETHPKDATLPEKRTTCTLGDWRATAHKSSQSVIGLATQLPLTNCPELHTKTSSSTTNMASSQGLKARLQPHPRLNWHSSTRDPGQNKGMLSTHRLCLVWLRIPPICQSNAESCLQQKTKWFTPCHRTIMTMIRSPYLISVSRRRCLLCIFFCDLLGSSLLAGMTSHDPLWFILFPFVTMFLCLNFIAHASTVYFELSLKGAEDVTNLSRKMV
jgi:hypothetical protein